VSITVDQAWVYRFHDMLNLTYQQKGSLLENLIDPSMVHRDVHAAIDFHERLGNVMANDVISPFGQTKILNPEHSRRSITLQSSDAAVLVSDEHTLRSMVNPQNGYTNTIVYALGRRADKHIIDALTGTATTAAVTTGSGVITFGTVALPGGRIIGGATAIDLARIINTYELMSKAGVPNGAGERIMLYSPGQLRDILAITQASSSDFTKNRIHDSGTINGVDWEGFRWIEIADVIAPDSSTVLGRMLALSGTTRSCIAFHRGAVGLSIGRPQGAPKINERPDLNNSIQVRQLMMMAAGRVWEGGVVQVNALEN
jgi:capsid protein